MISLGLKLAVPALVGVGINLLKKWQQRQELKKVRADMVEAVNEAGDMDDVMDMMQVKAVTRKLKKRLRYHGMPAIIKAIQYAEMKVGLLKRSDANKMVVDKIIRDYMLMSVKDGGLGMRVCDAVKNYQVAVTMYFLPRHQAVVCDAVGSIEVDNLEEAKRALGLDGSY
jgi:hypothetical protein